MLLAALVLWIIISPLVWIQRDGLGPKSVESVGFGAAWKFFRVWGLPGLTLLGPFVTLIIADWWLTKVMEAWPDESEDATP